MLVFAGRSHLYEGSASTRSCTRSHRGARGCTIVILTNAAGGLDPAVPVGTPMLLADHLNLTGDVADDRATSRPSRTRRGSAISPRRTTPNCGHSRASVDPELPEGVYAGLLGGAYETPAEIRMLRTLGADLVGMSTVLETIAARHLGARVLGISLVTNSAAGITRRSSHAECSGRAITASVLAAGAAAAHPHRRPARAASVEGLR